jgi:hypothetical protein
MSRDESLRVSVEDAREHAMLTTIQAAIAGSPEIAGRSRASLGKEPLVIGDLNGEVLFYDFELVLGAEPIGYVRVAANQLVGTPGVAIEFGARQWDFDRAVKKVSANARRELPSGSPTLVCYSYPKLGVMFNAGDTQNPVVYDVASFDRIPPMHDDAEGAFAWSFLDSIADRDRQSRLRRYRAWDDAYRGISAALRKRIVAAKSVGAAAAISGDFVKTKTTKTRRLQYCTHYNETEARSHHCFSLHAQHVNDYCAVATCQMVLCYYRYYYSQDQIAPALGYSSGSGCPSDQSGGYKSLTCKHLDAAFDGSPTFNKAKAEIESLHPFKSGITGHARACAGYSLTKWRFEPEITDRKLYIYDPWPWNADLKLGGAVYWEDWDAITHTNYVTTRINCP